MTCCNTLFVLHGRSCSKCSCCYPFVSLISGEHEGRKCTIQLLDTQTHSDSTKLPNYHFRGHLQSEGLSQITPKTPFSHVSKHLNIQEKCVCVCVCYKGRVSILLAYVRTAARHPPTLSLAARECERPMSTSMCFQQSHMVLTLDNTTAPHARTVLWWERVHRHNLVFLHSSYRPVRSPQRWDVCVSFGSDDAMTY